MFLKELCEAFGPSGCEDNVRDLIYDKINSKVDEIAVDKLGNLIAVYKSNADSDKKLMIAAHMDEVGFMITHIDDDGYLHFGLIGGIDPRVLCGRRVFIGDEKSQIHGVIIAKPIHLQSESERSESTPVKSMYIDIGADNKAEAEKYVKIGSFGTFNSEYITFGKDNSMIKSKAIDDRLGCALMCDIIELLSSEKIKLDYDIHFAFTVREEIGFSGAATAAYKVTPDKAIILESTAIADIPDVPDNLKVGNVGKGGVISVADNGTIYDRDFVDYAVKTAKKYNISYQIKRYISGGNDAAVIQKTKSGTKVLALSAPCRYLHTEANVINAIDYESMKQLLYHLIEDMEF